MATRSNRFLAGLLTGYGSIAANIVFTMTSIPLALHHLDREHFGLWALALQISGYLNLIDLGMSGAVSRFVADYKDDVNGGDYGSHLLTGGVVFVIQGLFIGLTGIVFSWFAPGIFAIPTHLAGDFRAVLVLLSSVTGASVALRSLGAPLWAFQRSDVVNGCSSIGLFITLALLWLAFKSGWGVLSFAIAQIPSAIGTLLVYTWVCHRNRYYPSKGNWGKPTFSIFKRIFHFGKDNLLITMGSQLVNASQIMIISRVIGLDAAATFSVATKFYSMAMQLVNAPVSAAAPGLAELHVRGENKTFVRRYWDLIVMTLAASTLVATCLAVGNRSLVSLWTQNAIQWSWTGDLLLGLLIVLRNLNGCFVGLFGLVKNWRPVRFTYLTEGIIFIPLAIFFSRSFGITGILVASIIAHVAITTTFSARAATKILGSWIGIRKSLFASIALIFTASTIAWIGFRISADALTMLVVTIGTGFFAIGAIWFFILPHHARVEVSRRATGALQHLRTRLGRPA